MKQYFTMASSVAETETPAKRSLKLAGRISMFVIACEAPPAATHVKMGRQITNTTARMKKLNVPE